jgi:hypothetical protein
MKRLKSFGHDRADQGDCQVEQVPGVVGLLINVGLKNRSLGEDGRTRAYYGEGASTKYPFRSRNLEAIAYDLKASRIDIL